jgi:hypothetical protein
VHGMTQIGGRARLYAFHTCQTTKAHLSDFVSPKTSIRVGGGKYTATCCARESLRLLGFFTRGALSVGLRFGVI